MAIVLLVEQDEHLPDRHRQLLLRRVEDERLRNLKQAVGGDETTFLDVELLEVVGGF